jgi:hypothetical protein
LYPGAAEVAEGKDEKGYKRKENRPKLHSAAFQGKGEKC